MATSEGSQEKEWNSYTEIGGHLIKRNGDKKIELDGIQLINTGIKLLLLLGALYAFTQNTLGDIETNFDNLTKEIHHVDAKLTATCVQVDRNEADIQRLMD